MKRMFLLLLTLALVLALSPAAQAAGTGDINFGVSVAAGTDFIEVNISGDNAAAIAALEQSGCQMEISVPCEFDNAYAVRDSKLVDSKLDSTGKKVSIAARSSGTYTVVNAAPPAVETDTAGETAKNVTVSENNARFLKELTVPCGYSAAEVYCGGKKVDSTLSGGKLTFQLDGAGKYEVREVTLPTETTAPPATTAPSASTGGSSSGSRKKTTTTASTVDDGLSVTEAQFSRALKAVAGDAGILLTISQSDQKAVRLSTASLKAAADRNLPLTLELPNVTLRLDSKALKALVSQASRSTVELQYRVISTSALNAAQNKILKQHLEETDTRSNALTFGLSIQSGGLPIQDLKGGALRLNIPFSRLPGTEAGSFSLWLLEKTGGMSGYDLNLTGDGLEFSVDRAGEFAVVLDVPAQEQETQPVTDETQPTAAETQPQTVPQPAMEKAPARGIPLWLPITAGICLLLALTLLVTRKYWS